MTVAYSGDLTYNTILLKLYPNFRNPQQICIRKNRQPLNTKPLTLKPKKPLQPFTLNPKIPYNLSASLRRPEHRYPAFLLTTHRGLSWALAQGREMFVLWPKDVLGGCQN